MSQHIVTVEWDGDHTPIVRMICGAAPRSMCHARWECQCEGWEFDGIDDAGPWHWPSDGDEKHRGTFDTDWCLHVEWFNDGEADLIGSTELHVEDDWDLGVPVYRIGGGPS